MLDRLVADTPGAVAAALVDGEGETVDYAGRMDTFELKIAAAHWQIVLGELSEATSLGVVQQLTVRARGRGYVIRLLDQRYAVIVVLHRRAAFAVSERALREADAHLSSEAGWSAPPLEPRWFRVDVEVAPSDRKRPARVRVAQAWQPVEVLGALVGLPPRERGYRVRLASGAEMMLVRERLGRWFSDERTQA